MGDINCCCLDGPKNVGVEYTLRLRISDYHAHETTLKHGRLIDRLPGLPLNTTSVLYVHTSNREVMTQKQQTNNHLTAVCPGQPG